MSLSDRVLPYLVGQSRLAEWATSGVMLAFGLTLVLPGDSIGFFGWPSYHVVPANDLALGLPMVVLAVIRFAALWVNGWWRNTSGWCHISPWIRIAGTLVGWAVFSSLALLFAVSWMTYMISTDGGPLRGPSPAMLVYTTLAVVELVSCWRAGWDAGRVWRS